MLHSSDPVPGSHESLEHGPWGGRRAPGVSTELREASGPSPQLIEDPPPPPPQTPPPWRGWVGGTNMEKKRDIKGSKGVTVGDKGWLGGGVLMSIYSGHWRDWCVRRVGVVGGGSSVSPNWLTKLLK